MQSLFYIPSIWRVHRFTILFDCMRIMNGFEWEGRYIIVDKIWVEKECECWMFGFVVRRTNGSPPVFNHSQKICSSTIYAQSQTNVYDKLFVYEQNNMIIIICYFSWIWCVKKNKNKNNNRIMLFAKLRSPGGWFWFSNTEQYPSSCCFVRVCVCLCDSARLLICLDGRQSNYNACCTTSIERSASFVTQ